MAIPSWETDPSLDSPEISRILWHLCVHCRGHTSLFLVPVLSKVNPVCILSFCLNIHLNVILPYVPSSSNPSPSFGICHQTPYAFLFSSICATCPFRCVLASYEKYLAIEKTRPEGKKNQSFEFLSDILYKKGKYIKYVLNKCVYFAKSIHISCNKIVGMTYNVFKTVRRKCICFYIRWALECHR